MKFTKMQGTGNDFIVIDQREHHYDLTNGIIQKLSDRNFGIGFDQLLIVEKSSLKNADFKYRIFNADGGEVEQCGNGARCFYKYIKNYQLSKKTIINVETKSGIISLSKNNNGMISVDMGLPKLKSSKNINDIDYHEVSIGNPHAVINLSDNKIPEKKYRAIAIDIQNTYKNGINVGFMSIVDKNSIKLKVFERGSGFTLACGSGACAAAAIAISKYKLETPLSVHMDGGLLQIDWDMKNNIKLSGLAEISFEGEVNLDKYA